MTESRTNCFGGCFTARAFQNELAVCSAGCGDIGNDFGVVMSESDGTVRFGLGSAAAVSHAGKCVVTGFGTGSCMIYGSTPAVTESLFFNGRSEVTIRALFLCYAGGFALCGNGTVIDEIMCNIVVNGIDGQVGGDVCECFIPTCKLLMRRSIEVFGMRGSGGSRCGFAVFDGLSFQSSITVFEGYGVGIYFPCSGQGIGVAVCCTEGVCCRRCRACKRSVCPAAAPTGKGVAFTGGNGN